MRIKTIKQFQKGKQTPSKAILLHVKHTWSAF